MIFVVAAIVFALLFSFFRFSFLIPTREGIPILMYHEVALEKQDDLTVSTTRFAKQMEWLCTNGYNSISLSRFLNFIEGTISLADIPKKPVLITFDDGYRGIVHNALPLLKQQQLKACLFVTTSYIEKRESEPQSCYLSLTEMRQWCDSGMEVALHSHAHLNYQKTTISEIERDLLHSEQLLKRWNIPFEKAIAYPYGARPSNLELLETLFASLGIRAAFRIGNRLAPLTGRTQRFQIRRLDIRGSDYSFEFPIKVTKGRAKLI